MMTRSEALQSLADSLKFSHLTAGEAVEHLSKAIRLALEPEDQEFFREHAEEPCHEVARACQAGRIWHGNENFDARRPSRWMMTARG